MKDDMTVSYWNSTGRWRMEYYKSLYQSSNDGLTEVELLEKQLDMAELELTYNVIKSTEVRSVLDIGCGVGRQIIYFASEFSNVLFWGVDIADYQIKLMTNTVKEKQLNNVFPLVMDACNIDSLNTKYDLITMYNNSLGCIGCEIRKKVILNVKRLLSKNGVFLFSSFDAFDMAEKCYAEWGINPVEINYQDRIVDLGAYKSIWRNHEMIVDEMYELGYNLISKKDAGLGTIYLFNSVLKNAAGI